MNTGTQHARANVVFTDDGFLIVDGLKIPLPKRPENDFVGTIYDILSLLGVVASVALVIAQLISASRA